MPLLPVLAATFENITLKPGGVISWIVAGLIAGWLAGLIVRGHGFGCLGNVAIGLLGAVVGIVIVALLPLHGRADGVYGFGGTLIFAFIGAFVLTALGRLIGGSNRRYSR
ncbi:MAG TPA: GlsB/YeaQ/YmgE family stress response membrane protein [Ktedonobacterales bacterium]|nr:GlsB/YeaQ/YmgE family stress response membrane protein [Ktedonobacterales bacterium]